MHQARTNAECFTNTELPSSVFDRPLPIPLPYFLQEGLTSLLLLGFFAERPLCAVQKVTQNIHCFRLILFDHKQTVNRLRIPHYQQQQKEYAPNLRTTLNRYKYYNQLLQLFCRKKPMKLSKNCSSQQQIKGRTNAQAKLCPLYI